LALDVNFNSPSGFSVSGERVAALGVEVDPVFAEPYWGKLSVALSRMDDPRVGLGVLAAGVTLTLSAGIAVFFLQQWKSLEVFKTP